MQNHFKQALRDAKTICIKIGTTRVIDMQADGTAIPQTQFLTYLGRDIKKHINDKAKSAFVVASGAVALGQKTAQTYHGYDKMPREQQRQLAFAFGNQFHAPIFRDCFMNAGLIPAAGQLISAHNFGSTPQRENLTRTLRQVMECGGTPVLNENDLTTTDELVPGADGQWSDNDKLAARLSTVMQADLLIILTDVNGVYTKHPKLGGKHIPYIEEITQDHLKMSQGNGSSVSTGGMLSKLEAAQIAQSKGVATIIAKGQDHALNKLWDGRAKCTYIPALP